MDCPCPVEQILPERVTYHFIRGQDEICIRDGDWSTANRSPTDYFWTSRTEFKVNVRAPPGLPEPMATSSSGAGLPLSTDVPDVDLPYSQAGDLPDEPQSMMAEHSMVPFEHPLSENRPKLRDPLLMVEQDSGNTKTK